MLAIAINFEHEITFTRQVEETKTKEEIMSYLTEEMGDKVDEIFVIEDTKVGENSKSFANPTNWLWYYTGLGWL